MGTIILIILIAIVMGIIFMAKSMTPFKCESCLKESNLNDKKALDCSVCQKKIFVCKNCFSNAEQRVRDYSIWCCDNCYEQYKDMANKFIVVKAEHVGKHKTLNKEDKFSHSREYKDRNRCVEELKFRGVKNGFNALTNLSFRRTSYTHSNGYIENYTIASGKFAKIKKKDR